MLIGTNSQTCNSSRMIYTQRHEVTYSTTNTSTCNSNHIIYPPDYDIISIFPNMGACNSGHIIDTDDDNDVRWSLSVPSFVCTYPMSRGKIRANI